MTNNAGFLFLLFLGPGKGGGEDIHGVIDTW